MELRADIMVDISDDAKDGGYRRVEVLTGPGRRRKWSDDDKARIVEETLRPARTGLRQVAQPIGRAYGDQSPEYRSLAVGDVSRKTVPEVLQALLTVPTVGAAYIADPKAVDQGFSKARLTALAPLHTELFEQEGKMHAAETARTAATRARVLAYNALNTLCSNYCARGYDHFVETDQQKAQLFVRRPAPTVAPAVVPPTPPLA